MSSTQYTTENITKFVKRCLIAIVTDLIPLGNTAKLLGEFGVEYYKVFIALPEEQREGLISVARRLNLQERRALIREISEGLGDEASGAAELIVESLSGSAGHTPQELLNSINHHLGAQRQRTLTAEDLRRGRQPRAEAVRTFFSPGESLPQSTDEPPEIEGYELQHLVGFGAQGRVYFAHELSSSGERRRPCAVKIGRLVNARRFERELAAMRNFEHPNLVELWAHGVLEHLRPPCYWMSLPYVAGGTLEEQLRMGLSLELKIELMSQVLRALSALHESSLAHLDLKPSNVLLTTELEVKLTDFGLSRQVGDEVSRDVTASVFFDAPEGTPAYISPEQIHQSREIRASSDIWSFGVMLYEALVGERPFDAQNLMQLGSQIDHKELDYNQNSIPPSLRPVLKRCLERSVRRRYTNASVLLPIYDRAVAQITGSELSVSTPMGGCSSWFVKLSMIIGLTFTIGAVIHHRITAVEQRCDGKDEDYDDRVDEDLTSPLSNSQEGICAGALKVCGGESGWGEPQYDTFEEFEIEEQSCDGLDNDCDGKVDEGLSPSMSSNQRGVCVGHLQVCGGTIGWRDPLPSEIMTQGYEAQELSCDGLDNDCDGQLDESLSSPVADNQRGVCRGVGKVCAHERGWIEPDYQLVSGHQAKEQSCDGLDNDCDGRIDEETPPPLSDHQSGLCEGARKVCGGQTGWVEPDYSLIAGFQAVESICDGVDSDCDGLVDEHLSAPLTINQSGVCAGWRMVCEGVKGWQNPNWALLPSFEEQESSCDGVDSDCDGRTDENLTAPLADKQAGICESSQKICRGSSGWQEPDYSLLSAHSYYDSICDGVDSDCDGRVDENVSPPFANNQNGVCSGSFQVCSGARGWLEPSLSSIEGGEDQESQCDGMDSDCDGVIDEGVTLPKADNQNGVCAGSLKICGGTKGWLEPDYNEILQHSYYDSSCNGVDNDCDGKVDEGVAVPLASNQHGVCKDSVKICGGTEGWREPELTSITGYEASESQCDGMDSDCDGVIDEGVTLPKADNQNGVCEGSLKICGGTKGWLEPDYNEILQHSYYDSSCNGVDNDCDGKVDEGVAVPLASNQHGVCKDSVKICGGTEGWREPELTSITGYEASESQCDGMDSDCDGVIDEGVTLPKADNQNGVCEGSLKICGGTKGWLEPDYNEILQHSYYDSSCNGVDNDCDGKVDEGVAVPLASNQHGVCKDSVKICGGTEGWREPELTSITGYEASESQCDGMDSDCDGVIDEGVTLPKADNQNGVCEGSLKICGGTKGWLEPDYNEILQHSYYDSSCNGVDNDCDGKVDEGVAVPLASNQHGVCKDSVKICGGTEGWREPELTSITGYEASESQCDGMDSDCDGVIDEGVTLPKADNQNGVCEGSLKICGGTKGWLEPDYNEILQHSYYDSSCNGVDNDCDGKVDENCD